MIQPLPLRRSGNCCVTFHVDALSQIEYERTAARLRYVGLRTELAIMRSDEPQRCAVESRASGGHLKSACQSAGGLGFLRRRHVTAERSARTTDLSKSTSDNGFVLAAMTQLLPHSVLAGPAAEPS